MANFGLQDLRVVNPYEVAFREAVSAVGGAHVLKSARVFDTVAESVADCSLVVGTTAAQKRELQQPIERIETGMQGIREHSGHVALLFGSEKFGLSNDDLSYCHTLIRIPTDPRTPSMNLGQAVAVCLYELNRGENAKPRRTQMDAAVEGVRCGAVDPDDSRRARKIRLHESDHGGLDGAENPPLGQTHAPHPAGCSAAAGHPAPSPLEVRCMTENHPDDPS